MPIRCVAVFLLAVGVAQAGHTPPTDFAAQRDYPLPSVRALAGGHVDGDGRLDVVVANYSQQTVTLLLSGGGRQVMPVGGAPVSLAVGDLNGDGFDDVVAGNSTTVTVAVFESNGDGTFQPAQQFSSGWPALLALADFNGDTQLDLAVLTNGAVAVLRGNGDGSLQPPAIVQAFSSPRGVIPGEFTGDAAVDIAVPYEYNKIAVVPGRGDGTFLPAIVTVTSSGPFDGLAVADLNADGRLDLAGTMGAYTGVLLGLGDGRFPTSPILARDSRGGITTIGDFNADGVPDVAAARGEVQVLLGNGDGTLQSPRSIFAGGAATSVVVGEWNADGRPDIAIGSEAFPTGYVSLRYGRGDGTFYQTPGIRTGLTVVALAPGDFNEDGHVDLAAGLESTTRYIPIIPGNGDGNFRPATSVLAAPNVIRGLVVTDLDLDSHQDLAVAHAGPGVRAFRGVGDGAFHSAQDLAVGQAPTGLVAGDFNEDGFPDLVFLDGVNGPYPGAVLLLVGSGDGTFQTPAALPSGVAPAAAAVLDINVDSHLDLAVAMSGPDEVWILLGRGDGTFDAGQRVPAGVQPESVAAGDVNGDGVPDIVVISAFSYDVRVSLGNGDGTVQPPVRYLLPESPRHVRLARLNGDSTVDIAVAMSSTVLILNGIGDGTFELQPTGYSAVPSTFDMEVVDFTSDGKLDIAVAGDGRAVFDAARVGIALLYSRHP